MTTPLLQEPTTGGSSPSPREFSILRRRGPWRDALRRRMLALADVIAVLAATGATAAATGQSAVWVLAALPVWVLLAKLYGLYDNDHRALRYLTADELPHL